MTVWQRRTIFVTIGLVFAYLWTGFVDLQVLHHRAWQARSIANERSLGVAIAPARQPVGAGPAIRQPKATTVLATLTPSRLRNFLRRCTRKARIWVARPLRSS